MPIPQENSLFVEQAGEPVAESGARCEDNRFHIYEVHQPYR